MEERKKMFYLYKTNLFDALFYIISSFFIKISLHFFLYLKKFIYLHPVYKSHKIYLVLQELRKMVITSSLS